MYSTAVNEKGFWVEFSHLKQRLGEKQGKKEDVLKVKCKESFSRAPVIK